MKKIIFVDKSALKEIAKALKISLKGVNINKIAGFDEDGIIYNDINSLIDYVDKMKKEINE